MGTRGGFLNAMVREAARAERQAAARQRQAIRFAAQQEREQQRRAKVQAKEERERYLQSREDEVSEKNEELKELLDGLSGVLAHTLSVNDLISFESLKLKDEFPPYKVAAQLSVEPRPPVKMVRQPPGFFENCFSTGLRGMRKLLRQPKRNLPPIQQLFKNKKLSGWLHVARIGRRTSKSMLSMLRKSPRGMLKSMN